MDNMLLAFLSKPRQEQTFTIDPLGKVVVREMKMIERLRFESAMDAAAVEHAENEAKKSSDPNFEVPPMPSRSAMLTAFACYYEDGRPVFSVQDEKGNYDFTQARQIDQAGSTNVGPLTFKAIEFNFVATPAAEDNALKNS